MEDEPFISAILAAPDDDLPRLVYADYLDETGRTDRAEFIRLQIESARLPPGKRRDQLVEREQTLIKANGWGWASNDLALFIDWRRGFEYKLHPAARGVLDSTALSELAAYPMAEELGLGFCCGDEEFQHMPDLPNLRRFQFGGNTWLSDASVPRIARWGTLRRLEMQSDRITDAGLPHLAPLVELTHLDLSSTQVTDDGLRHLTALRSLEKLDLSNTRIDGSGLTALAGLPRLRRLKLGAPLLEPNINRLVGCDALEELDYSKNFIGFWDQPLIEDALAPLQRLPKLRVLNLGDGLEEPAGVVLAVCRRVPTLQELHFNGERLI